MKRHIQHACLSGVLALSLLSACDADQAENPQAIKLQLYGGTGMDSPWDGVGWVKATVRGDQMADITTVAPLSSKGLELENIPFSEPGQKRTITVEGYSDAGGQPGYIISRGHSEAFEVYEGGPVKNAKVFLAKVNAYSGFASINTGSAQRLSRGRFAPAVTVTPREILISGGATLTRANARWWGGEDFNDILSSQESISLDGREVGSRSDMASGRVWHTATPFSSGQVIIGGGFIAGDKKPTASVELYNPPGVRNGATEGLPPFAVARAGHTMTLLSESERLFLVVGGDETGTWELWSATQGSLGVQPLPDGFARSHHQATLFKPKNLEQPAILISGGESKGTVLPSAMIFDTATNIMSGLPSGQGMPGGARVHHSATWIPERGYIYITGGFSDAARQQTVERIDVFHIDSLDFIQGYTNFKLHVGRGAQEAVLLHNNAVYIAGGYGNEGQGMGSMRSMELIYEYIDPATQALNVGVDTSFTTSGLAPLPNMPKTLFGHRVVNLNGMAVVIGGASLAGSSGFQVNQDIYVYNPR